MASESLADDKFREFYENVQQTDKNKRVYRCYGQKNFSTTALFWQEFSLISVSNFRMIKRSLH
jgi:hypothetical protein